MSDYPWYRKPPAGTPLDRTHPLASGLLGFWPFNEGAGPFVSDAFGSGVTGTLTGAVNWISSGPYGAAINFSGGNVRFSSPLIEADQGTIFLGALNANISASVRSYIFDVDAGTTDGLGLQHYTDGNIYFGWAEAGGNRVVLPYASGWPMGYPITYGFTWSNGGETILYLNGTQIGSATPTVTASTTSNAWLGDSPLNNGAGYTYRGIIDCIGVYDRVLAPGELAQLSANRWQIFAQPPGSDLDPNYYPWLMGPEG